MRAERQYYFDSLSKVEVKYTYSKFSCQMREQGSSVISIMGNQDVLPINPKIAELLISPDKSRVRVEDFFKQQSLCRLFQKSNDFLLFYLPQMLPEMPAIKQTVFNLLMPSPDEDHLKDCKDFCRINMKILKRGKTADIETSVQQLREPADSLIAILRKQKMGFFIPAEKTDDRI